MTSSGGDVPAERAAAAVIELVEAREGIQRLKSFLMQLDHRPPWAELVSEADGVLNRLSNAMSALDGARAGATAGVQSPAAAQSDGARTQPSASSSGNTRKRSFSKRSHRASDQRRIVTATLDDGYVWRKYGQKEIQNSPHPRSYFRCTHRSDRGCNAKRQVQVCDADPSKHVVTYIGEHTCNDPSKTPAPLVIHAAAPGDGGAGNLISFAASRTDAATASAGVSSTQQTAMDGTAAMSTSWFSPSAGSFTFMQVDELGAVVGGSAAAMSSTRTDVAGSAPVDNGGTTMHWPGVGGTGTGAGAGSFPSSPNSLGFEVGDDDLFRFRFP